MPSVVATIKVKPEVLDEAKTFLTGLAEKTLANEAGTLVYTVHQKKGEPTTFVFYEKYQDEAAFAVHGENLKAVGKDFAKILAGAPDIVMLDEV